MWECSPGGEGESFLFYAEREDGKTGEEGGWSGV